MAADRMALVTCRQPGGVGHVVLYVDTDDGAFILDNAQERPVSPVMLDYEWEAMLCGGEWRGVAWLVLMLAGAERRARCLVMR